MIEWRNGWQPTFSQMKTTKYFNSMEEIFTIWMPRQHSGPKSPIPQSTGTPGFKIQAWAQPEPEQAFNPKISLLIGWGKLSSLGPC